MFTFGEEIAAASENTALLGIPLRVAKRFRSGAGLAPFGLTARISIEASSKLGDLYVLALPLIVKIAMTGGFGLSELRLYRGLQISYGVWSVTSSVVRSAYWESYYGGLSLEIPLRLYENLSVAVQGIVPGTEV